jgi:NAD(P)H-nitrite reductase large subunit
MTADAAVQGIRSVDPAGEVGLLSTESDPPYNRPPLSKALWKGESVDTIWRKSDQQNVVFHLACTATAIELAKKQVVDAQGNRYSWEKLLLATGGSPRRLPFGDDRIIYFRTLADYRRLRALTEKGLRFAVMGGGLKREGINWW